MVTVGPRAGTAKDLDGAVCEELLVTRANPGAPHPSHHAFELQLERDVRQWLELDTRLAREVVWPPENGSPFRGLRAFHVEHAPIFFGCSGAIEQARALLAAANVRGAPYILILGMGGSGKSSLVQAGLIPRRG